ncbi:hypothetical protein GOP47_0020724 [Adiantum capillus-veneris]|uniref:Phosphoribosylaminoimidazole-succinocarboxamide synthase, chloroplastic n=1 Tax=Adiantum capillus-veneris TaxID=13818 RepID=A0A9D4U9P6_ADICA|nr:hypothetical protein GOP47_0020724 [Adiantum capillus-veneris]
MAAALLRVPTTPDRCSFLGVSVHPGTLHSRLSTGARTTASLAFDLKSTRPELNSVISKELANCLAETHLHQAISQLGSPSTGKVRDIYDAGNYLILIATDRLSAFDRILASVPFKGQVLNQTSLWWFNKTEHIIPNAVISSPDPNVTIATKCKVFPVEFVVRGYVTGSTSTSLWTIYAKGLRNYCGNNLPNGLVKNQRLSANILTPTTKATDHDLPISGEEIVGRGLMSQKDFEDVRERALALFAFGQQVAAEHGLILVDTKYEFGKAPDGSILLIDEVHTPDSSRYWVKASYEERFKMGLEPENIDKEFLRLWFKENCDPYNDKVLPSAPSELVSELARRYILLHDTITGEKLQFPDTKESIHDRISRNVSEALRQLQG